jgi:hypothetical protein
MPGVQTDTSNHHYGLPIIAAEALRRPQHDSQLPIQTEKTIARDGNIEFTMWLHKRAVELAPNILDRGVITQLAYEALGKVIDQLTANELVKLL